MTLTEFSLISGSVFGISITLGGMYKFSHWLRRNERVWEQIKGMSASPGVPALPSMIERITSLEDKLDQVIDATRQLLPNGGSSIADAIRQIQIQVGRVDGKLEDHLREVKNEKNNE